MVSADSLDRVKVQEMSRDRTYLNRVEPRVTSPLIRSEGEFFVGKKAMKRKETRKDGYPKRTNCSH